MGRKFELWQSQSSSIPRNYLELMTLIQENRKFRSVSQLSYGDFGLQAALDTVTGAIKENKKIALYADYDVDGTMSCVSWIWFLEAIGYKNYTHYIPCRFEEGYGLNLDAIKHLVHEVKAELIITMDTGITANVEAAYCAEQGVDFICTDHHKIQAEKMPDCVILNPKLHPDPDYQELCGCGITFVLLRQLGKRFPVPAATWNDILAITGMATICDVVPLNGVNHKLANLGVNAILKSQRPILKSILKAAAIDSRMDEKDVGFRIGPRINAVGRLKHANTVVEAFLENEPDRLVEYMGTCIEERKGIQTKIFQEASLQATDFLDGKCLFLGGDWHQGVVGIAASKIAERYWRPTWLFQRNGDQCKGSARSIPGFDVTEAMAACSHLFEKFGGHKAAGGFSFPIENEQKIREALQSYCEEQFSQQPSLWQSKIQFDCRLPIDLLDLALADSLEEMKPFGHGFEEPIFQIEAPIGRVDYYKDKSTGEPKHTAVTIKTVEGNQKVMFFNEVFQEFSQISKASFIVSASRNTFRGRQQLSLMGHDWELIH